MKETYHAQLFCKNCGAKTQADIPKGTYITDYLYDEICPECGCDSLTRDLEAPNKYTFN